MNLTDEIIRQAAENGAAAASELIDSSGLLRVAGRRETKACEAFARAAIETALASDLVMTKANLTAEVARLTAELDKHRWRVLADEPPTADDADYTGEVIVHSGHSGCMVKIPVETAIFEEWQWWRPISLPAPREPFDEWFVSSGIDAALKEPCRAAWEGRSA